MARKLNGAVKISAAEPSVSAKSKPAPAVSVDWQAGDDAPEVLSRIQETKRRLILEAALDVFSSYGFRGSTIDQIALKAGMSKPNILYYFRRKEDIYVTVLQRMLEQWLASLRALDPDGDPLQELAGYIRTKLELAFQYPEASRLFANEILQGAPAIGTFLREDMRRLVDEKAAMIGGWMAAGKLAQSDPHHLIFSIWATTQHYSDFETQLRAVLGIGFDAPDMCEKTIKSVSAILLDGIRPR
ncbi:HTH-type transcriptional regulator RutR [Pseudochrobactrum sp. MP213Fo]|uniref:HTH-type transcriptional regulator RutR n=1 Tax=Pseudochrobactrum sp. MP213Fo TaxID=3022250 RepID=UPI003BA1E2E2